jgi:hypothetical protein
LSALAALVMFGRPRPRPATTTAATTTTTNPATAADNVEDLAAAEHALAAERARCRLRHPTARTRLTV